MKFLVAGLAASLIIGTLAIALAPNPDPQVWRVISILQRTDTGAQWVVEMKGSMPYSFIVDIRQDILEMDGEQMPADSSCDGLIYDDGKFRVTGPCATVTVTKRE